MQLRWTCISLISGAVLDLPAISPGSISCETFHAHKTHPAGVL